MHFDLPINATTCCQGCCERFNGYCSLALLSCSNETNRQLMDTARNVGVHGHVFSEGKLIAVTTPECVRATGCRRTEGPRCTECKRVQRLLEKRSQWRSTRDVHQRMEMSPEAYNEMQRLRRMVREKQPTMHPLTKRLEAVLQDGLLNEGHFLFKLIEQQLQCLTVSINSPTTTCTHHALDKP